MGTSFEATEKKTIDAEEGAEVLDVPARSLSEPLGCLCMGKQIRWLVGIIETDKSVEAVFDLLWPSLDKGERRLSVRRAVNRHALHFLIYKADQAKLEFATLPEEVRPAVVYELLKPGRGQAGTRAILQFARAWFADFQQIASNFNVAEDGPAPPPVDVKELWHELREKPQQDLHFDFWRARLQSPAQRAQDPRAKALLAGKGEISAMRRAEEKRALKRQLTSGIVYHVGTTGSKLVYPCDFPGLPRKKGNTWDPIVRKDVNLPFADYVNTRMHFEKVLVLWGGGGRQKTPTAAGIANHLAENYDAGRYCKASSPDALKPAQEYFGKCVTVILEELCASDVSQNGRKMNASYLKQLFEIRDGGQCRVRNTCVCFHPLQPKILCINDTPEDWLRAVEGFSDDNNEPLKKRMFFVRIDEPAIAPAAVAAHEADLDAIVAQGKRRRRELQGGPASEPDLAPTTAGSADVEATSTPGDSGDDDDVPDNAASASLSDASKLPAGASGPLGPDGKPLFARLPQFVAVYMVFATEVLVRMGEMPGEVHQFYLAALRSVQPNTDTTTLKLVREWLSGEEITKDALYNLIIGQTVLPNWRRLEALGPFSVEAPQSPEEFASCFRERFPGCRGVVPPHLKQGVLSLLGNGPEAESCGRFIYELAAKIPEALAKIQDGAGAITVLQQLGNPRFRALLVARLLSIGDPALYNMEQRHIGDFAELGLWLLLGHQAAQARAMVGTSLFKAGVDKIFLALVEALPSALAAVDQHGVVERLARLHLLPTSAQCVEHMLCEWRKMCLPEGRTARGDPFED